MSGSDPELCDADLGPKGVEVKLTEDDIPGASLSEPLEARTMPKLRWWLLCRGIQPPTSMKKAQIITRYLLC